MPDWRAEIERRMAHLHLDPAREAGIVDELSQHLEDYYSARIAGGASPEEARQSALRELASGGIVRGLGPSSPAPVVPPGAPARGHLLADLWQDLRFGLRALRKTPAYTFFAMCTLAFGIGATTCVFTVLNTLVLNALPIRDGAHVAAIESVEARKSARPARSMPLSYPAVEDLRARSDVFTELTAYSSIMPVSLTTDAGSQRLFTELAAANYFKTFGLTPALGRFFTADEDRGPGAHPVIVIGHSLWQRQFGGAADVLGRTMRLNQTVFTIVGVAPRGFKGINALFGPDLWAPIMMSQQLFPAPLRNALTDRSQAVFRAAGRLKPGFTLPRADAEMKTIASALAAQYPETDQSHSFAVRPIRDAALGDMRQPMLFGGTVLMAVVSLILLIACSNVANLLLARGAARRQEIAVRLALGARRGRLIRQLLTESVLLAMAGGLLGLGVAYEGVQIIWSMRPAEVAQNFPDPKLDGTVLLFTAAVSFLTGLIFGIVPAIRSSRADLVETLKEEGRSVGRSRSRVSFANALIVGQVALSLVCLITSALFLRAIASAYQTDTGFQTAQLAILMTNPGQLGFDRPRTEQFYRDVHARMMALPGVASASWASNLPLWGRVSPGIVIEGQQLLRKADAVSAVMNTVDVDYFEAIGIPILRGRDFHESDRDGSLPVAIVNATMAARYWPGQDAIGKRVQLSGENFFRQIVGVARTANYQSVGEAPQPAVYVPLRQHFSDSMVLYLRARRDPNEVLSTMQKEVHAAAPGMEAGDARTGPKIVDQALWGQKIGAGMLGIFGLIALGLACVGLYGVMAYAVQQRRRELGVRIAMGAARADVLRLVLRQGLTLAGVGVAIGLVSALAIGRMLRAFLLGANTTDALSLGGASAVLLAVAALACYVPARRASRVDPMVALREA